MAGGLGGDGVQSRDRPPEELAGESDQLAHEHLGLKLSGPPNQPLSEPGDPVRSLDQIHDFSDRVAAAGIDQLRGPRRSPAWRRLRAPKARGRRLPSRRQRCRMLPPGRRGGQKCARRTVPPFPEGLGSRESGSSRRGPRPNDESAVHRGRYRTGPARSSVAGYPKPRTRSRMAITVSISFSGEIRPMLTKPRGSRQCGSPPSAGTGAGQGG
jgi:hypothetical protein